MDLFNFNYEDGGAKTSPVYPMGSSVPQVVCKDCFAYLGATAFVVVDWDGLSLAEMRAGITGNAAFNYDLEMSTFSGSFTTGENEVFRQQCFPTIT